MSIIDRAKESPGSFLIVVILAVVVLGGLGAGMRARTGENGDDGGFLGFNLPEIVINLITPDSGAQDWPDYPDFPDYPDPPANSRAPTALNVFVTPNNVDMGDWIEGSVTSNGYNWPLRIVVTHTGTGETGEIAGWLGDDGQFYHWQEINIPGVYEATAYTNGLSSATITFVVQGIIVVPERGHYSKTMSDDIQISVYTHHTRQNAGVVGHYPAGSISRDIGPAYINDGGYGTISPNLDAFNTGDWELDAIIGGDSAMAWGGTYWISVGR